MKRGTLTCAGLAIAAGLMASSGVQAEDPNWMETPLYGTLELSAGFSDDPRTVKLQAGGSGQVDQTLAPGCRGNINLDAPDVDLNYESGNYSLYIYNRAAADTTIVVYDAEGRWHCNDDFGSTDPMIVLHNPPSGNYNIWVGVYDSAELIDSTLHISEINPLNQ